MSMTQLSVFISIEVRWKLQFHQKMNWCQLYSVFSRYFCYMC